MTQLFDLTGRIALVTGSTQGLGHAIARGLADAGAHVVINGRNGDRVAKVVEDLKAAGCRASGAAFDVTAADQIRASVTDIETAVGPIDILVNNAGIQRRAPLEDMEESVWREVIETNLNAIFLVTQPVVRGMIRRRAGKVINICSLTSEVARPTIAPYATAKGGLKMLTRAMAVEWTKHNVQVNGIGPGYFATEMNRALIDNKDFDGWVRGRTPAGRWGDPSELQGAAVFLSSRASDFVSGQIIYVDGGLLAAM
jgi:gluconate 5-dehydrogenase